MLKNLGEAHLLEKAFRNLKKKDRIIFGFFAKEDIESMKRFEDLVE